MGKRTRESDEETEGLPDDTSEELKREPTSERRAPDPAREDPHGGDPGDDVGGDGDGRRTRVMRFAKRLMDRRELSNDTREILGTVLATSDKAKTEAVRLVAREVRSYLDALELKEDLKELLTGYSLEISLSLKPLERAMAAAEQAGAADDPQTDEK